MRARLTWQVAMTDNEKQIVDMGFPLETARKALSKCAGLLSAMVDVWQAPRFEQRAGLHILRRNG